MLSLFHVQMTRWSNVGIVTNLGTSKFHLFKMHKHPISALSK